MSEVDKRMNGHIDQAGTYLGKQIPIQAKCGRQVGPAQRKINLAAKIPSVARLNNAHCQYQRKRNEKRAQKRGRAAIDEAQCGHQQQHRVAIEMNGHGYCGAARDGAAAYAGKNGNGKHSVRKCAERVRRAGEDGEWIEQVHRADRHGGIGIELARSRKSTPRGYSSAYCLEKCSRDQLCRNEHSVDEPPCRIVASAKREQRLKERNQERGSVKRASRIRRLVESAREKGPFLYCRCGWKGGESTWVRMQKKGAGGTRCVRTSVKIRNRRINPEL